MDENCHALLGWHPMLSKLSHLSIKDDSLFVCHAEISQFAVLLEVFLVLLESFQWVGVHWHDFIMYRPILQELLNIEK